MNNKIVRTASITMIALIAGLGITSCSNDSANSSSVSQEVNNNSKAEVKKVVDTFFVDFFEESKAVAESAGDIKYGDMSSQFAKENYPKTFSYMSKESSEAKIVEFISAYTEMAFPNSNSGIQVDESNIDVESNQATFYGNGLRLFIDDEERLSKMPYDDAESGVFTLIKVNNEWKFTEIRGMGNNIVMEQLSERTLKQAAKAAEGIEGSNTYFNQK